MVSPPVMAVILTRASTPLRTLGKRYRAPTCRSVPEILDALRKSYRGCALAGKCTMNNINCKSTAGVIFAVLVVFIKYVKDSECFLRARMKRYNKEMGRLVFSNSKSNAGSTALIILSVKISHFMGKYLLCQVIGFIGL